jgi:hypothetical protein
MLAFQFGVATYALDRNLSDITDEEGRQAPPQGGNSLNWIVGHLVRTRNQTLGLLGAPPLFADADFAAYVPGGDADGTLPLSELKRRFDALGPLVGEALASTTASRLAAAAPFSPTGNPDETIGTLLASLAFHEAYHIGQTGLARRLLGKRGAILGPGEKG